MPKTKSKAKYFSLMAAVVLVVIDQLIKRWAVAALPGAGRVEVIPGLFYFTYVENRGAAFGLLQGQTTMLSVLTGLVLLGLMVAVLRGWIQGRVSLCSVTLIIAGGVGNLVDRTVRSFVVDYLDFSALFGFPVFNFADCCVVVGTLLLLCCIVWGDLSVSRAEKQAAAEASVPEEAEPAGSEGE